MAPRFEKIYPVNFSRALRCALTLLRVKLRVMLRMMLRRHDVEHDAARDVAHDAMPMLRMMLRVTVPLAHDATQPLSPNLSCPFLLSTSLVHICVQLGCASRLAVLVAEVYLAHYFCACKLRFSSWRCESALSEHYSRAFKLKLRCSSWSCASALRTLPLRENTYDFAAGAGAAAGMHFAYNFGRSHGNAFRAPLLHLQVAILQLELSESSSRAFVLKTCRFFSRSAAGMHFAYYFCTYKLRLRSRASGNALRVLLGYLKLANFQPKLRECASRTNLVLATCNFAAAPLEILFTCFCT